MGGKILPVKGIRALFFGFAIFGVIFSSATVHGQTITTVYTAGGQSGLSGTNPTITFAVQNANAAAVTLQELHYYELSTDPTKSWTLWYKSTPPTPLTGPPGAVSVANGWTVVAGPTMLPPPAVTSITPIFTNINFNIPAGTTYRFALTNDGTSLRYYGSGSAPNTFTNSNITLHVGDAMIGTTANVGYSGGITAVSITPRFFQGTLVFGNTVPPTVCSAATVNWPALVNTTTDKDTICDESVQLNLSATMPTVTGITYQWQRATASSGPWTNIGTAQTTPAYTAAGGGSYYYRCQVLCGATVQLTSNPAYVHSVSPDFPVVTGASRCGHGVVTLQATPTPGTLAKWYDAPTGGTSISTGPQFATPYLTNTTTYYVSSATSGGALDSVFRTLAQGNTTGIYHHMFAVRALNTITIQKLKIKCSNALNTSTDWEIYYRPDNYQLIPGANTSSAGWTLIGSPTGILSQGTTAFTTLLTGMNITIPASQTHSFYIAPVGAAAHQYGTGTLGAVGASNADAEIIIGHRGSTLFNVPTAGGIATVNLEYGGGCESGRTPVVATITPAPAVDANTVVGTVCVGGSTTVTASSSANPNYSYSWSPGNTIGNSMQVFPGFPSTLYTVHAVDSMQSSPYFGCVTTDTVRVHTTQGPPATITPDNPAAVCPGVLQTLNTVTGAGFQYQWYRDNVPVSGATSSSYNALLPGLYSVRVVDNFGCDSTSSAVQKTDHFMPHTSLSYNSPLEFCAGNAVILHTPSGPGITHQWYRDNNAIAGATDSVYTAQLPGAYTVEVSNPFNCTQQSNSVQVIVNTLPQPAIIQNGWNLSTGVFVTYQWYRNGQAIGGATGQNYTVTQDGAYTVEVTDANGCKNQSQVVIISNTTGIDDVSGLSKTVKLYPNPTSGKIQIESPVGVKLYLQNATGQLLGSYEGVTELDLSNYANGIYVVTIQTLEGAYIRTDKMVKQ